MGLDAGQNRAVLGIEISSGVARGVRLDVARNEIVATGAVRLGGSCCDETDALDPSLASICLDPLLDLLQVTDRSNVEVGIAIGPRHSGVGSGSAMQSWLSSRSARLGQPLTYAGDLGISFAPSRTVDAAAKSILELGLEPARVDLAPVAAARAYGKQIDGIIRVGSGRGWQARMRNFEVLEAMEVADVSCDEAMSIEELDGSITRVSGFGWTEVESSAWDSRVATLGSLAVAVGSAVGVAFESAGNLLDGTVVGGRESQLRRRPNRIAVNSDESTLRLRTRELVAPEPMHRREAATMRDRQAPLLQDQQENDGQHTLTLSRVEVLNPAVASVSTQSPSEPQVDPTVAEAVPDLPVEVLAEPMKEVISKSRALVPRLGRGRSEAVDRPTTEVQMAAMASWQNEELDLTDPINLFSPQIPEDHLRGESRHGFGIPHFLLVLVVLGILAAGALLFVP